VFLIAAPDTAAEEHLAVLSRLARAFMREDFTDGLRSAATPEDVVALVQRGVGCPGARSRAAAACRRLVRVARDHGRPARIVAVTACATGIAHTFMAADALTAEGKKEDRPRRRAAGLVGLQGDRPERHRRRGCRHLRRRRRRARPAVRRQAGRPFRCEARHRTACAADLEAVAIAADPTRARSGCSDVGHGRRPDGEVVGGESRILLTGVSYMIPFVAGGGLLIALGFLLGGYKVTDNASRSS
jgi:PTS system fructose-specific IIC component